MVNKSEIECIEMFKSVLKTNNVETQKRFDFIRGDKTKKRPKGTMLPLDAYFPLYNFVLEYMGKQHFLSIKHFDRRQGRAEQRKRYDNRKAEKLKEHKITLIYFKYDEKISEENIKNKLIEYRIIELFYSSLKHPSMSVNLTFFDSSSK